MALIAGPADMTVGGVGTADEGGPGTGYGIVGGYIALAIGLIAAVLGWSTLSRARRTV